MGMKVKSVHLKADAEELFSANTVRRLGTLHTLAILTLFGWSTHYESMQAFRTAPSGADLGTSEQSRRLVRRDCPILFGYWTTKCELVRPLLLWAHATKDWCRHQDVWFASATSLDTCCAATAPPDSPMARDIGRRHAPILNLSWTCWRKCGDASITW